MRIIACILLIIPLHALGQTLTSDSRVAVTTRGGEAVILYSAVECGHCYYYLPCSLRISASQGKPEISFVVWNDEETTKPAGGIFHMLVEWGMRSGGEGEVQDQLRKTRDSLGVVMGPALVYADGATEVIQGKDRLSAILRASLKNKPALPTTPGAKMALSFHFSENEIADFLYYLKHPAKTSASLIVTYSYAVMSGEGLERMNKITVKLPFKDILKNIR